MKLLKKLTQAEQRTAKVEKMIARDQPEAEDRIAANARLLMSMNEEIEICREIIEEKNLGKK